MDFEVIQARVLQLSIYIQLDMLIQNTMDALKHVPLEENSFESKNVVSAKALK